MYYGVLVPTFSDPGFGVELRVRQKVVKVSPTIRESLISVIYLTRDAGGTDSGAFPS
jgi:hypothetical protein